MYISSLPSKGIRSDFVDALNHWLQVPAAEAEQIKGIANTLHNSSLMCVGNSPGDESKSKVKRHSLTTELGQAGRLSR